MDLYQRKFVKLLGILLFPAVLFLLFMLITPGFRLNSLPIVMSQAVIPTLLGFGMAFGMAAGQFDLSAGSRVILAASMGGLMSVQFGIAGLIAGSIVTGILTGAVMGLFYNLLRIPSLVLSLGFVMLLEVLSVTIMANKGFMQISPEIAILGKRPWNYVICLIVVMVFFLLYYRTRFSYHVRVVGNNQTLAQNIGIKVNWIHFLCFVLGGAFFGLVGILQISYSNNLTGVVSMASMSMVFQPMMGVMIGMELCALIDNLALNILIGELCISIIFNGIIALGFPAVMQNVILGFFMIVVMAVSANVTRIRGYSKRSASVVKPPAKPG
jgi:ribose transport system permease protein